MNRSRYGYLIIALAPICLADSWSYSPELVETVFPFGALSITRSYDGRDTTQPPKYWVDITDDGVLVSRLAGVGFQDSAISPDGRYFVGISNSGLDRSAYFVIDQEGKLIAFQKHAKAALHYCDMSVTLIREWYNSDDPPISFTTVDGGDYTITTQINVAGCDGRKIELLKW